MAKSAEAVRREQRQARVGKAVWGILLIVTGALLGLEDAGRITLAPASHPAEGAVDGDMRTRWASDFSDPQSFTVDLGHRTRVDRVTLHWENAHARKYRIEVSDDNATWTTVRDEANGDGGADEIDGLDVAARYVRVAGTERATPFGYSFYELEVYGKPAGPDAPAENLAKGMPVTASSFERRSHWVIYWPMVMIAGALPALLAPKDGNDQIFALFLFAVGGFLQVRNLGYTEWGFAQVSPVLFLFAGLVLVVQALRPRGARPGQGGEAGGLR